MEMLQTGLNDFLAVIINGLLAVASAYAIYLFNKLIVKIKVETAKIKDEKARVMLDNAINGVDRLVKTNVIAMENTMKKELIEASKDGKVTREELQTISVAVQENVLNQMTEGTLEILNGGIGDVNQYLEAKIEEELAKIKGQI